jgi:hypothetical protein
MAIKGAKAIGRVDLLINDQTVPKIMGPMPFADWKEWAIRRPEWAHEELGQQSKNLSSKNGGMR